LGADAGRPVDPSVVVKPLVGDPVDRDQRAVEDRVRQSGGPAHRRVEVDRAVGEQVNGLAQDRSVTKLPHWAVVPGRLLSYRELRPIWSNDTPLRICSGPFITMKMAHCRPPNTADDWSPGGDPLRTPAAGLRKLAKTLAAVGLPGE
jgi:hypothetical protein